MCAVVANRMHRPRRTTRMRALTQQRPTVGPAPDEHDRGGSFGVEAGPTHYVRSGDGHIAYQVLGEGAPDILLVNESVLPMEALADNPFTAAYLRRLTAWGRVIMFDRRGVGLSDPVTADTLTLEDWVADAIAVLDAVDSASAAVLSSGPSAGLIGLLLASSFPERVTFLSLYDAIARYRWAPDYPGGVADGLAVEIDAQVHADWGEPRLGDRRGRFAATAACHPAFAAWATTWFRRGASPSTIAAQLGVLRTSDVRAALPAVVCPTLVINHAGVEDGPFLAAHIAGARYVELADPCHLLFAAELDTVMAVTSEMVNGSPVEPAVHRMLTTLLFTDIVGSTARVAAVGDRSWGLELDQHEDMVGRQIRRCGGRLVKTLGDGVVATFDAPSRAVQCAFAIQHEAATRGLAVRAGVHTGEVEQRGADVLGLSVHIAQRICALATADEVLVSQQVVDLAAGSDLSFQHHGDHVLRGLGGRTVIVYAASVGSGCVSHLFVEVGCTNAVQLTILAHDAGVGACREPTGRGGRAGPGNSVRARGDL
jgi:class 3 adenylate cyclase